MVLWSEFSWKNRNRWLYDSEIFKEPIENPQFVKNAKRTTEHWFNKHPPKRSVRGRLSTDQITDPKLTLENYTLQKV